mgnify:FL=1
MTQIKINPQNYQIKISKDGDVVKVVNTSGFSRVDVSNYVPAALGLGDMLKSVYDTDDDGIVDNSEQLGGQLPSYYLESSNLTHQIDATKIAGGLVSNTEFDYLNGLDQNLSTNSDVAFDSLTINDLYVAGSSWIVNSGQVSTSDNIILLNYGEVGAGVTAGSAGIQIDRGSSPDYQFIFDEPSDSFKIGEIGSLQKVATREDSPNNNSIPFYNSSAFRFDTESILNWDSTNDRLGVGTISPSSTLHVAGSNSGVLRVEGVGITGTGHLVDAVNGNGTNVFNVTGAGRVGIGVSAPATTLDVLGTIQVSSSSTNNASQHLLTHTDTTNFFGGTRAGRTLVATHFKNIFAIGTSDAGALSFSSNSSPSMAISRYMVWDPTDSRWETTSTSSVIGHMLEDYSFNGSRRFRGSAPQSLTAGDPLTFNEVLYLDPVGRIGVGTITPSGANSNVLVDTRGHIRAALSNSVGTIYLSSGTTNPYLTYGTITDTFTFGDNNSYKMSINAANGRVGIGTTGPTAKLHLATNGAGDGTFLTNGIFLQQTNGSTAGEVAVAYMDNTATGSNYWIHGLNQSNKFAWAYGTGFADSTTKMTLITDGFLGIGTTAPATVLHLANSIPDIVLDYGANTNSTAGHIVFRTAGTSNYAGIELGRDVSPLSHIAFLTRNSASSYAERIRIDAEGRLGVNTTTPTTNLHVVGGGITFDRVGNFGQYIDLYREGARKWQIHGGITSGTDDMRIRNASTTGVMTFLQDGKIGIGDIASPASQLYVYASNSSTDVAQGLTIAQGSTGDALLQFSLPGVARWMMGIDNSDSDKFKISGLSTTGLDNNNRLTIDSNGYVGIGTESPATALDVTGAVTISSYMKASDFRQGSLVQKKGSGSWGADATAWQTIASCVISNTYGYSDLYGTILLSDDSKQFAKVNLYVHYRSQGDLNTDRPLVTYSIDMDSNATSFQSNPPVQVVKTADTNGGSKTYEIQVRALNSAYGLCSWELNYNNSSGTYTHTVNSSFATAGADLGSSNITNEGNKYFANNAYVTGNLRVGPSTLATSDTDGFLYISSCAGVPTGTPTSYTGRVPMVYDSTNNELYIYNSGWKAFGLPENGVTLSTTPTTLTGNGYLATFTVDSSVAAGTVCYLNSANQMIAADADGSSTSVGLLGLATANISASASGSFVLYGFYGNSGWSYTTGQTLYISTTPGAPTATQPSGTGDIVRVVGHAVSASSILFNPGQTYIELT